MAVTSRLVLQWLFLERLRRLKSLPNFRPILYMPCACGGLSGTLEARFLIWGFFTLRGFDGCTSEFRTPLLRLRYYLATVTWQRFYFALMNVLSCPIQLLLGPRGASEGLRREEV